MKKLIISISIFLFINIGQQNILAESLNEFGKGLVQALESKDLKLVWHNRNTHQFSLNSYISRTGNDESRFRFIAGKNYYMVVICNKIGASPEVGATYELNLRKKNYTTYEIMDDPIVKIIGNIETKSLRFPSPNSSKVNSIKIWGHFKNSKDMFGKPDVVSRMSVYLFELK